MSHRVAPTTGAWIETRVNAAGNVESLVAPTTGAWIETNNCYALYSRETVAPTTGAWIETRDGFGGIQAAEGRSHHGSVD